MRWKNTFLLPPLCLFISACSGVFYQPDRFMHAPPELNHTPYENLYFRSTDGTILHAWYLPPSSHALPKGIIIQFHGNAENISSHYLSLSWLTKEGYGVFTFDYRGYGQSAGEPTPEGLYQDGLAALNEAWKWKEKTKSRRFVVYGQSLGGAVAMRCFSDFPQGKNVDLVVMDSTFQSYKDVARQTLAKSWLTWIFNPLGSLLVTDRYSSESAVKKLETRLLVIHDKRDPVVNFENGQEIYNNSPSTKDLWTTDFGSHVGIFYVAGGQYRKEFINLLNSL